MAAGQQLARGDAERQPHDAASLLARIRGLRGVPVGSPWWALVRWGATRPPGPRPAPAAHLAPAAPGPGLARVASGARRRARRSPLLALGLVVAAVGAAALAAPRLGTPQPSARQSASSAAPVTSAPGSAPPTPTGTPTRSGSPVGRGSPEGSRPREYRPDLLRTGVGIPPQYRQLIVAAGTTCVANGLSPALVAAMLKVESNFDPNLSDPARDEYGIARWTPRVLQFYLPEIQRGSQPKPPFPPEVSIPAVGRYLCFLSANLTSVPGEPALLLAAAYRTSAATVANAGGIPAELRPYTDQVAQYLQLYRPPQTA